ncbi:MAG TPA: prenyltransferase [Polyangiaceae bacterium]
MLASEQTSAGSAPARLWAFIRLGRPQFLVGGFVMFGLGAEIARVMGIPIRWPQYLLAQAVVTSTQVMTNYSNEYFDFDADRANRTPTRWSGGSRVLADNEIPRSVALTTALVAAMLALALTVALYGTHTVSNTAASLMPVMLLLAWAYSAPPFRLHSRGLGELTAAVVVAVLVPWFGFLVQAGSLTRLAMLAVIPLALLQFAMLLSVEFPDRAGDAAVGKKTLVVRLAVGAARRLHHVSLSAAYLLLPVLVACGLPTRVALAVLCTAPLALVQLMVMRRDAVDDVGRWEQTTFISVLLVFAGTVAELLGFAGL